MMLLLWHGLLAREAKVIAQNHGLEARATNKNKESDHG